MEEICGDEDKVQRDTRHESAELSVAYVEGTSQTCDDAGKDEVPLWYVVEARIAFRVGGAIISLDG